MKKKRKYPKRRSYRRRAYNHGRTGEADLRGNVINRRRRKLWMLKVFGNGKTAPCIHCGKTLNYETITSDRIIPGCRGGSYRRENIQPACKSCNDRRSVFVCDTSEYAKEQRAMMDAFTIRRNPRYKTRYSFAKKRRYAA